MKTLRTNDSIYKAQQGKGMGLVKGHPSGPGLPSHLWEAVLEHTSVRSSDLDQLELKPRMLDSLMTGKDIKLTFTILSGVSLKYRF